MIPFDPASASAAWLARIPAAERLAAQAHTDVRLIGWAGAGVIVIAGAAFVARSGLPRRLKGWIEAGGPRPWLASAVLAGALALVLALFKAPLDAWTAWRCGQILAQAGAPIAGYWAHLGAAASSALPIAGAAMLIPPPLQALMRARPRTWPLIAGGGLVTLALVLGWLPYALSAGPPLTAAPSSPARDGVMRLITETGTPAQTVYLAPELGLDADVTGGFGRAKVSMGPLLLAGSPTEARAYVGHVMGHYAHGDILAVTLVWSLVVSLGFVAMQRWAGPAARWMGARNVIGPGDSEALPSLAVIGFVAVICAGLAGGAYLRLANVRADAFSLEHAREPDGLAAVIEREWRGDPTHEGVDPSPLEEAIFYTHPALQGRIAHAMDWKASHGG